MREKQVQIIVEEIRQCSRTSCAYYIYGICRCYKIDSTVEIVLIGRIQRSPYPVDILIEHTLQHVLTVHLLGAYFDTLNSCELVPHKILQLPLQLGIAVIAKLGSEPDHCGLTYPHGLAKLLRRHERSLVILGKYVICDKLMSL